MFISFCLLLAMLSLGASDRSFIMTNKFFLVLSTFVLSWFVSFPSYSGELLAVGVQAPDFSLSASTGEVISLSSFRGKKQVVLYFYPKDNTPGCTKEAQNFRDDYSKYEKAGAVVLGVSVDDEKSHKSFAEKQKLKFPLLADVGGKVATLYGVMGWIMAKRVTYLIGTDGKIKQVFSDIDVDVHSKDVLRSISDR